MTQPSDDQTVRPDPDAEPPTLTVVVLTWNSASEIDACLRSIASSSIAEDLRCIVIDNASADSTVDLVRAKHPWVDLRVNSENTGFSRGCNLGLDMNESEYVMLLNPDTQLEPTALEILRDHLDGHPPVGMVGPRLVLPDGTVQSTCARTLPTLRYEVLHQGFRLHNKPVGRRLNERWQYPYDLDKTQPVEAISGSAMMMRRSAVDAVGLLDPIYRHCGEDFDLCARYRAAGWRIDYVADAIVEHAAGSSSAQAVNRTTMESLIGKARYFSQNVSKRSGFGFQLIIRLMRAPVTALRALFLYAKGRDKALLRERIQLAKLMLLWRPYPSGLDTPGPHKP